MQNSILVELKKKVVLLAFIFVLLSTAVFVEFIKPVEASETIYIKADGSVVPDTAPISSVDNVTYTFTGNIDDSIVVETDNVVVDGAGYTLHGTGSGKGIDLSNRKNVTIQNVKIKHFTDGIWLFEAANNTLIGNNITANKWSGIRLTSSSNNNSICGNNIRANTWHGIELKNSSNNSISGNTITNNIDGIVLWDSSNYNSISGNNITNNNSNGILLWDSSNNSLSGNNITDNFCGIRLEPSSNNNNISDNTITNAYDGIVLALSSNNSVSGNTFTNDGLLVWDSYHNVVEDNTVNGKPLVYLEGVADHSVGDAGQVILVNCTGIRVENLNLSRTSVGVQLWQTSNSSIAGNTIANNNHGILLGNRSSSNSICENNITANNSNGISLEFSSNNSVSGNTIAANNLGIRLGVSSNNRFYHNHFINNSQQVSVSPSEFTNVWDDGYPSGGNYWDDYSGLPDLFSGPEQNIRLSFRGGDGVGDSSYVIDEDNIDRYPLRGTFSEFSVNYGEETYDLPFISNSTVSAVEFDQVNRTISFNVTGEEGIGFCRVSIPHDLIEPSYTVTVNNNPVPYDTVFENETLSIIYFSYSHSTQEVIIIPEFPTWTSMLLILTVLTVAIAFYKRKLLHAYHSMTKV